MMGTLGVVAAEPQPPRGGFVGTDGGTALKGVSVSKHMFSMGRCIDAAPRWAYAALGAALLGDVTK